MITVAQINIAPVKSMALVSLDAADLELGGIRDDRRFYLANESGRLLTRRQLGKLAQLSAAWDDGAQRLRIAFPDGAILEECPELGSPVWTLIWGRRVRGRPLLGEWSAALSAFCGQPVSLLMSNLPGQAFDEFPVSVLSHASIARLSDAMGRGMADSGVAECLQSDRFRPTLLLDGGEPHQEDGWLTQAVRVGEAVIRILAPDPRCAIINQHPATGAANADADSDVVKAILGYRPNPLAAYFGVYGIVEKAGLVRVGDAVTAG